MILKFYIRMDLLNIQKTLFREFSCLLNSDIENQIRKNNDALDNIDMDSIDDNGEQHKSQTDNLLYKFYLSFTKMSSLQKSVNFVNTENGINFASYKSNQAGLTD